MLRCTSNSVFVREITSNFSFYFHQRKSIILNVDFVDDKNTARVNNTVVAAPRITMEIDVNSDRSKNAKGFSVAGI